jgi:glutathione synthase/RimK-type ligase-like ATP-grasp enzyme
MLPVLAVVYDGFGAVTPMELILESDGLCELLFVCDMSSPSIAQSLPMLETAGTIVKHDHLDMTVQALRSAGVSGIIAFRDKALVPTAELASRLNLPFHTPSTAAVLSDKYLQRKRLRERGVDAIRFALITNRREVSDAVRAVGTPAVLKPCHSAGGRNTSLVTTADEALLAAERCFSGGETSLILEEYLLGDPGIAGQEWGDYVSVETLVMGGVPAHIGVTGKMPLAKPFRETGNLFPSTVPANVKEQVLTVTTETLSALGVQEGACHTELKLTSAGPRLIEVNGRLGGCINDLYARASGESVLRLAMAAALRKPVLPTAPRQVRDVAYQLFLAPPIWARRVLAIDGVDVTRALSGVRRVEIVRGSGSSTDWTAGFTTIVGTVYGDVPDHAALETVLSSIRQTLLVEYGR